MADLPAVPDAGGGDDAFDLDLAVSSLAADRTDVRILLKQLVAQLGDALGPRLVVERAKGLFKRSDEITRLEVTLGEDAFSAQVDGSLLRCSVGHTSGGIRIRSESVDTAEWLRRLLGALQGEAAHSQSTRAALERMVIGGSS